MKFQVSKLRPMKVFSVRTKKNYADIIAPFIPGLSFASSHFGGLSHFEVYGRDLKTPALIPDRVKLMPLKELYVYAQNNIPKQGHIKSTD